VKSILYRSLPLDVMAFLGTKLHCNSSLKLLVISKTTGGDFHLKHSNSLIVEVNRSYAERNSSIFSMMTLHLKNLENISRILDA
jgi:hypothetical protein